MTTPEFRLQMCDACCCGTERKHPNVDHERQRAQLSDAALAGGGTARIVDCLGECQASNVIVVLRSDGDAVWLGHVLGEAAVDGVCEWLKGGAAAPPSQLAAHVVSRTHDLDADAEPATATETATATD